MELRYNSIKSAGSDLITWHWTACLTPNILKVASGYILFFFLLCRDTEVLQDKRSFFFLKTKLRISTKVSFFSTFGGVKGELVK